MSKGNLFLGQARGKVGSVVFSRVKGKQITRSKAESVKNPRSSGQNTQRAIFATATVASKFMSDLVDHTFDSTKNGQDDRNRFVSLNTGILRTALSNGESVHLLEKGGDQFAPNAYVISEGDQGSMPILPRNGLLTGHTVSEVDVITVGDIKQLYPKAGPGTQFTIVIVYTNDQDTTPAMTRVAKCRFVLGANVTDDTIVFSFDDNILNVAALDDSKTEGFGEKVTNSNFGYVYDITSLSIPITFDNEDGMLVAVDKGDWIQAYKGIIITNVVDGKYKHSNCVMQKIYDFAWTAESDAIASYGNQAKMRATSDYYADQAVEDEGYVSYSSLNEAISGTIQSQGYQAKSLNLEGANSYGPIPEGNYVDIWLQAQPGVQIPLNSIQVLVGETAAQNLWKRSAGNGNYLISLPVAFGASNSVQLNVTFDVAGAVDWENMGFRCTVSKVQA